MSAGRRTYVRGAQAPCEGVVRLSPYSQLMAAEQPQILAGMAVLAVHLVFYPWPDLPPR